MTRTLLLILFSSLCLMLSAQDETLFNEGDSIAQNEAYISLADSLVWDTDSVTTMSEEAFQVKFKPDPNKAVIYSAVFPGLGQIYNRKYWKLPIVYGGFLGCIYGITWNNNTYRGYQSAYRDFSNARKGEPAGDSWQDYVWIYYSNSVGENWTDATAWNSTLADRFSSDLKTRRDKYRRNKEMVIFATIGVYVLCMVDAYVDAQLFDFDISEDLSLRVDPILTPATSYSSKSFGLQCSFTF